MADSVNIGGGGIGLGWVLFIVFLVLKLTNTIDWSWWIVTMPLWGPIVVCFAIGLIAGIIWGIYKGISGN